MSFEIGQKVFSPHVGIGVIKEIKLVEIAGTKQDYIILDYPDPEHCIQINGVKSVMVPVSQAHKRIFSLPADEDLQLAKTIIAEPSRKKFKLWTKQGKHFDELMDRGDLASIATVYRDARRSDLPPEIKRSYSEQRIFEEAEKTLAIIFAHHFGMDVQTWIRRLEKIAFPEDKKDKPTASEEPSEQILELPDDNNMSLRDAWAKRIIKHPYTLFALSGHLGGSAKPTLDRIGLSLPILGKDGKILLNKDSKPIVITDLKSAFAFVSRRGWVEYATKNMAEVGKVTAQHIHDDLMAGVKSLMQPA